MIGRIITGIGALFGGALSSQFPEFYQQYLQRLGGRRDQAMARAEEIVMDAESHGLGVADYVQRFLDSEQHALEGRRMLESFEGVLFAVQKANNTPWKAGACWRASRTRRVLAKRWRP